MSRLCHVPVLVSFVALAACTTSVGPTPAEPAPVGDPPPATSELEPEPEPGPGPRRERERARIDPPALSGVLGRAKPEEYFGQNFDFEAPGTAPEGWFVSGGGRYDYEAVVDRTVKHGGSASARLVPKIADPKRYGTMMQAFYADAYRGKRVVLTAFVRGLGIEGRGDFWARVQAESSPGDGPGLGGGNCRLAGDFEWRPCTIAFDVPADGHEIQFGIGLAGRGTAWLDDVRLEVVGVEP